MDWLVIAIAIAGLWLLRKLIWPSQETPRSTATAQPVHNGKTYIRDLYGETIEEAQDTVLQEIRGYAKARFTPIGSTLPTKPTPHPAAGNTAPNP